MKYAEIVDAVRREVAAVVGVPAEDIGEQSVLSDHDLDSLELIEIGVNLERVLGIQVSLDSLRDVTTIGELADHLVRVMPT